MISSVDKAGRGFGDVVVAEPWGGGIGLIRAAMLGVCPVMELTMNRGYRGDEQLSATVVYICLEAPVARPHGRSLALST